MRARLVLLALLGALVVSGCGPRMPEIPGKPVVSEEDKSKPRKLLIKERNFHLGEAAKKDVQLAQLRKDNIRAKCYWVSGIALFALFACVAAAIFIGGFRRYAVMGAVASVAVCALALTVAAIVDYLVIIGAVVLAGLVVAAVVYWKMDADSRDQVVMGFETMKDKMGTGYKKVMRSHVTPTSDKLIDKARKRMGLTSEG